MQLLSCRVGTRRMDDIPADIASVDRWATLTNDQRARMLDAALLYLERAKCNPGQWLGQNVVFHPARAAYRAMVLMKTQRPADLDLISDRAWQEWAPVLADWTTTVNGALWEDKEPILERALAAARPHLADALVRVFEGAAERGAAVYAGRELSTLMDRELASRLVALLGHGSMTLSIEIAKEVGGYDFALVRPILVHWLGSPSPQLALVEHTLGALWDRDEQASWRLVADRLDACEDLAAQVVGRTWVDDEGWTLLPAGVRADVYLWMLERFPRTADPDPQGAHWVGPREQAAQRRDRLFAAWSGKHRQSRLQRSTESSHPADLGSRGGGCWRKRKLTYEEQPGRQFRSAH